MHSNKYTYAIFAIVAFIMVVIGIQIYWNILNYNNHKQQLFSDVLSGLDNAVESYISNETENNTLALESDGNLNIFETGALNSITKQISGYNGIEGIDSLNKYNSENLKVYQGKKADSIRNEMDVQTTGKGLNINRKQFDSDGNEIGSSNYKVPDVEIDKLVNTDKDSVAQSPESIANIFMSRVIITVTSDSISLTELDTLVQNELRRKNINATYGLKFIKKDSSSYFLNRPIVNNAELTAQSKSTFLPKGSSLFIYFDNPGREVLLRSLTGISISVILILGVILILFYLLKIINNQKQLAEIKNDLISNITHEFKTPISIIQVALEGIQYFNQDDDPRKTQTYLTTSNIQLKKLNLMVEKLLETATLDQGKLELKKEEVHLETVIAGLAQKHRDLTAKSILFKTVGDPKILMLDPFHIENALNNLLDNAIKYGGSKIIIHLIYQPKNVEVVFEDSGNHLTKEQGGQIFEKFYRVPQGNTHDIKGFGIGLYYTQNVIEKHNGRINLEIKPNTKFIISLPYDE